MFPLLAPLIAVAQIAQVFASAFIVWWIAFALIGQLTSFVGIA